ncbi:hypothetical protein BJ912DRAFT_118261 [Pholiota molesta]|nr:hypothetical protein BJ912DRAFT_118261 [Pholiota molesta]
MDTQVNQIVLPADTALSYLALAGATCMIYDHLTTLDIEIEVVWNRPKWQIPQFLFFLNRYVGLVLQIYTASFFIKHLLGHSPQRYSCTPTPSLKLL